MATDATRQATPGRSPISLPARLRTSEPDAGMVGRAEAPADDTQDADLADFDSHTAGVRLDWFVGETTRLDFGFDYVTRSDGLDALLATFGSSWRF